MFDITTARQIGYGPNQELTVTVFQDRTLKNIWYMVPVPRLRIQNGQPAFTLTRYRTAGGGGAGVCAFEVELESPADARLAAEQQIPGIEGWGQFTWVGGDAFFDFDLGSTPREVVRSPSLFGSNVAYFQVELESDADVNSFVSAFTAPGSVSPFRVAYDMRVLTQLLAAEATVIYTATAAMEYERKYETKKDTWGNSKQVLTEVRQVLKESGAGDVKVKPGKGATPELLQLVHDWAWTTLETQVANTLEAARALAEQNGTDPVSASSDFTQTYSEDAIVEWSTPVFRFLPKFDDATWAKLYREVDNRELVVTFQLAGAAFADGGVPLYEDVVVTVEYLTRTTDNTFRLIPGSSGFAAKTYVAPGQGAFDPTYRYQYTVNYPGGEKLTSGWITESATLVEFRPNRFGIRKVEFVGANVPFAPAPGGALAAGPTVDRVFIDFFDNPPNGQPAKLQTRVMTTNGEAVCFTTTYRVPIANTYDYRLRYLLSDGQVITFQPDQQFGSSNADLVQVLNPFPLIANLALRAIVSDDDKGFLNIDANATYFDDQNPSEGPPPNYDWSGWAPEQKKGLYSAATWYFDARPDTQTAFFKMNGQIVYGDGDIFELTDFHLAYSKKPLILKDTEEVYSVGIFPDQVAWDKVTVVTVNVFQLIDGEGSVRTDAVEIPVAALRSWGEGSDGRVAAGAGGPTALIPYKILSPAEKAKSLPLYYTLRRATGAKDLVFYFNADYVMKDGTVKSIGDTTITNKLQIHLPPLPTGDEPQTVQRLELAMAAAR